MIEKYLKLGVGNKEFKEEVDNERVSIWMECENVNILEIIEYGIGFIIDDFCIIINKYVI